MAVSKRLRFRILRRDNYACVYCGRRAPSVALEIDHRIPRAKGGSDHESNLVSACWDCNRGKGPLDAEIVRDDDLTDWMEDLLAGTDAVDYLGFLDDFPFDGQYPAVRRPLRFDFDVYAAAVEIAPASMIYADTADSVFSRAEAF